MNPTTGRNQGERQQHVTNQQENNQDTGIVAEKGRKGYTGGSYMHSPEAIGPNEEDGTQNACLFRLASSHEGYILELSGTWQPQDSESPYEAHCHKPA
ncbi:hypothetical protein A2U01_0051676 [Trifolium medium]|uniref:Uncharacterized protein n=1 Tax=Trifolium medium TaxID=97028 RepID=A0A392R2I8_9FABA|nr:hypothetical protein [Trifolium medium]